MNSIKVFEDAERIVALTMSSANRKTGDVVQSWILSAENRPSTVFKYGRDTSICGDCALRSRASGGTSACYVVLHQGPDGVFEAVKDQDVQPLPAIDKAIRLGSYGDPAFVPRAFIEELLERSPRRHFGYTHAWEDADPETARFCMASIENVTARAKGTTGRQAREKAKDLGYRTFRVLGANEDPLPGEIMCPHYTRGVQCKDCSLCAGTKTGAKDIVVRPHGHFKRAFYAHRGKP